MTDKNDSDRNRDSRRQFLTTSASGFLAAGMAATQSSHAFPAEAAAVTGAEQHVSGNEIARLESDQLVLRVLDTGTFAVAMKEVHCQWFPDPWEGIPCRIVVAGTPAGKKVIDLGGPGGVELAKDAARIALKFKTIQGVSVASSLELKNNVVYVTVRELTLPAGTKLISLHYPFRCFYLRSGKDQGYLAVPSGEGCLIPSGPVKLGTTDFFLWHDYSRYPNSEHVEYSPVMPFYGAQKEGAGYVAILETPNDFVLQYLINSTGQHHFETRGMRSPYMRIACAWPEWLSQHGQLGYERRLRLEFKTGLDYVGMAKAYRKEAIAQGDLVTLREKSEDRPQIARLAGAPYLSYSSGYPHELQGNYPGFEYTYKQLGQVIDDLIGPMGIHRALIPFKGCYSKQPPESLPWDTKPGSLEEMIAVFTKAKQAGLLLFLYNDVSAQLEESDWWKPELMWKTADGEIRRSYRWDRTCSSQYRDLLAKDLPQVVKTLGVEGCYVDVINSGRMNECYDPNHPLTRSEDRKVRMRLYDYVHSLGLIYGGEHAGWWNVAGSEFTNGTGFAPHHPALLTMFSVPLYQLVFHDAVVAFPHALDDYTKPIGLTLHDKVLRDLLRGIPPMFFLNLGDHNRWRRRIIDTCAVLSEPSASVMYDEMLSHRWITDDRMVQHSAFSSGVEVLVNFDEIPREGLPGKAYRIVGLKGGIRKGRYAATWNLE